MLQTFKVPSRWEVQALSPKMVVQKMLRLPEKGIVLEERMRRHEAYALAGSCKADRQEISG